MHSERKSFWQLEKGPKFSPMKGSMQAGTVVVGAGLCGLLCAYFLHNKGARDIVIIDSGEVCGGVSAKTTAKISSQHGLIYAGLLKGLGKEKASRYFYANQKAIEHYRSIIRKEEIGCDFFPCNSWIYTTSENILPLIEEEKQAARELGIDVLSGEGEELILPVMGAVGFPGQAHFHPLKFAYHICNILVKAGCKIYTHTTATGAETGIVYTDRGDIGADHIISCSHYPFIDKHSLMFTKLFQHRFYVLGLKKAGFISDMYLDPADGGFSLRPQKDEDGQDMILFGGYDHKTGHEEKKLHFDDLRRDAKRYAPRSKAAYIWSAQDCMTHDKIPYIGAYQSAGEGIYVATGFNKWGMTSSMVAAEIISDLITKGSSEEEEIFNLSRKDIGLQAGSFMKEAVDVAGNFLTHLKAGDKNLHEFGMGEGGVIDADGRRVGVYKDNSGQIYAVKPVCTHMGCAVKWNKDENTWDCTCHGSRFDHKGKVLGGPALNDLERI